MYLVKFPIAKEYAGHFFNGLSSWALNFGVGSLIGAGVQALGGGAIPPIVGDFLAGVGTRLNSLMGPKVLEPFLRHEKPNDAEIMGRILCVSLDETDAELGLGETNRQLFERLLKEWDGGAINELLTINLAKNEAANVASMIAIVENKLHCSREEAKALLIVKSSAGHYAKAFFANLGYVAAAGVFSFAVPVVSSNPVVQNFVQSMVGYAGSKGIELFVEKLPASRKPGFFDNEEQARLLPDGSYHRQGYTRL